MYSYSWDIETGGFLLNSTPMQFSKEPRPVYSRELDILGFDKYWNYDKDDSVPLMWAEANNYIYKGRLVATAKGGSITKKPEISIIEAPEPYGEKLQKVNIKLMVQKNHIILEALVHQTVKQIYNSFIKYRKKGVDVFYVAFSGGKDSVVTLDLVQKTLPHNEFKVLFGDTGMEFPDTYETVNFIENWCKKENISFIRAKSKYQPCETWAKFGPPATVNRWCCSVHKTAPQILALRKITGIHNFTGMAFIGVRASESLARSGYDYISIGEKHKGQWSCNPILEWNSAELYAYIYSENLYLNKAYTKGNRRAGCLVCPRAAERSDYFAHKCYPKQFEQLIAAIRGGYDGHFSSQQALDQFVTNGGWKARKNGRDLNIQSNYEETETISKLIISIRNPRTDWKQWIKTIGILQNTQSPYLVETRDGTFVFEVEENDSVLKVAIDSSIAKMSPNFFKLFKNVFHKVALCVQCGVCEADCHNGAIHMDKGTLYIDGTCKHCSMCHKVERGCLVYKSLERPKGISIMNKKNKSLNCYSHHAPKMEWFDQFFKYKEAFAERNTLGSNMFDFFKRFLKDAELMSNNVLGKTADVIDHIGLDDDRSWALMMTNLVYSPQFNWFANKLEFNEICSKEYVISKLVEDGAKESWVSDIWSSFSRISELPFFHVGFGQMTKEGRKTVAITRTPWLTPSPEVVLYSLYKFAEACDGYYQFTMSRLYDSNVESDGVSPVRIFGIEEEEMKKILKGLSINHPDFISVTFTLDLDNINLREDKTAHDVLDLF